MLSEYSLRFSLLLLLCSNGLVVVQFYRLSSAPLGPSSFQSCALYYYFVDYYHRAVNGVNKAVLCCNLKKENSNF